MVVAVAIMDETTVGWDWGKAQPILHTKGEDSIEESGSQDQFWIGKEYHINDNMAIT